jgi:hypothetical protein
MAGPVTRGHVNRAAQASLRVVVDSSVAASAVTAAVAPQIAELQAQISALATATPEGAATVGVLELDLPAGRRGGRVLVAPATPLAADQVGAPVLVLAAASVRPDEAEGVLLQFVGDVLSTTTLRLHWAASGPAPARVRIHYLIGQP